jgi:hypothetical protein
LRKRRQRRHRLHARAGGILCRCATDPGCISNLGHFPDSPFALLSAGIGAACIDRVHGTTLAQRLEKTVGLGIQFER